MRKKIITTTHIFLAWVMAFYPILASGALKSLDDEDLSSVNGRDGVEISGNFGAISADASYVGADDNKTVNLEDIEISSYEIQPEDPITINVENNNGLDQLVIRSPESPPAIDMSVGAIRVGPAPNNTSMGGVNVEAAKAKYEARIWGDDGVRIAGEVETEVDRVQYVGETDANTFNATGISLKLVVDEPAPITMDMIGGIGDRRLSVGGTVHMPYLIVDDMRFGTQPVDERLFGLEIQNSTSTFVTNWNGNGPTTGVGINMNGSFTSDTELFRLIGTNPENTTNAENVHLAFAINNFDFEVIEEGISKMALTAHLSSDGDMLRVGGIRFGHSDLDEYIGGVGVSNADIQSYTELYGKPGGVGLGFEGNIVASIGNMQYTGLDPATNTANLNDVYASVDILPSYFEVTEKNGKQWGHLFSEVNINEATVREVKMGSGPDDISMIGAGLFGGSITSDTWFTGGGVLPGTAGITLEYEVSAAIDRAFIGGHDYINGGDLNNTFNLNGIELLARSIDPVVFEVVTNGNQQYLHIVSPNSLVEKLTVADIRAGTSGNDDSMGGFGLYNWSSSTETWIRGGGVLANTPGITLTTDTTGTIERIYLAGADVANDTLDILDVGYALSTIQPVVIEVVDYGPRQAAHIVAPETFIDYVTVGDVRMGVNGNSFGSGFIDNASLSSELYVYGMGIETGSGLTMEGSLLAEIEKVRYEGASKAANRFDLDTINLDATLNSMTIEVIDDGGKQKLAINTNVDFDLGIENIQMRGMFDGFDDSFGGLAITGANIQSRDLIYGGPDGQVGIMLESGILANIERVSLKGADPTINTFDMLDISADVSHLTSIQIIGPELHVNSDMAINTLDINSIMLGADAPNINDSMGGLHVRNLGVTSDLIITAGAPESGVGATITGNMVIGNANNFSNSVWLSGSNKALNRFMFNRISGNIDINNLSLEVTDNGGVTQFIVMNSDVTVNNFWIDDIRLKGIFDNFDDGFGGINLNNGNFVSRMLIRGGGIENPEQVGVFMSGDFTGDINLARYVGSSLDNTFNLRDITYDATLNSMYLEVITDVQQKLAINTDLFLDDLTVARIYVGASLFNDDLGGLYINDAALVSRVLAYGGGVEGNNPNVGLILEGEITTGTVAKASYLGADPTIHTANLLNIDFSGASFNTSVEIISDGFKQKLAINNQLSVPSLSIENIRLGEGFFNYSIGGFQMDNLQTNSRHLVFGRGVQETVGIGIESRIDATIDRLQYIGDIQASDYNRANLDDIVLSLISDTTIEVVTDFNDLKNKVAIHSDISSDPNTGNFLSVGSIIFSTDNPQNDSFGGIDIDDVAISSTTYLFGKGPNTGTGIGVQGFSQGTIGHIQYIGAPNTDNILHMEDVSFLTSAVDAMSIEVAGNLPTQLVVTIPSITGYFEIGNVKLGNGADLGGFAWYNMKTSGELKIWGRAFNDKGINFAGNITSLSDFVYTDFDLNNDQSTNTLHLNGMSIGINVPDQNPMQLYLDTDNNEPTKLIIEMPEVNVTTGIAATRVGFNADSMGSMQSSFDINNSRLALWGRTGGGAYFSGNVHINNGQLSYTDGGFGPDNKVSLDNFSLDINIPEFSPGYVTIFTDNNLQKLAIDIPMLTGNVNTGEFFKVDNIRIGNDSIGGLAINDVNIETYTHIWGNNDGLYHGIAIAPYIDANIGEMIYTDDGNTLQLEGIKFKIDMIESPVVVGVQDIGNKKMAYLKVFPTELSGDVMSVEAVRVNNSDSYGSLKVKDVKLNDMRPAIAGKDNEGLSVRVDTDIEIGAVEYTDTDNDTPETLSVEDIKFSTSTPIDKDMTIDIEPDGPQTAIVMRAQEINGSFEIGAMRIKNNNITGASFGRVWTPKGYTLKNVTTRITAAP